MLKIARALMASLALVSMVLLVTALSGTPATLSLGRVDLGALGSADVSPTFGVIESLLLTLVSGVGTVVAVYSARNLVGQRRLDRFAAYETVAVAGLAITVTSSSLPVLAAGWTVATLALAGLVAHAGTPQARRAARQVRARLLLGDALLWAGVLVVGLGVGTLDRATLAERIGTAPASAVTLAALLVVGAGVVRSALLPAHRWLPETAEAPSPVSALLHAGLVNGVGVLALLLWPLIEAAPAARLLLLAAGAATAVVATAQMRTRADVKGRLAASTSSQMGYLAVQAALGIPAAVLAHVIGHGVWKASLFLGAGGAVGRARAHDAAPTGRLGASATLATGMAALAAVAAAALVPARSWQALTAPADLLPLGIATGVLWVAIGAVVRRRGHLVAGAVATAVILGTGAAYIGGLRALGHVLEDGLGSPAPWGTVEGSAAAVAVALLAVAAVAGAAVDRSAHAGRRPALARRAARSSLQPLTLRERMTRPPSVALTIPAVTPEDAAAARLAVEAAARTSGALFPLTSFVASNPLAGLEDRPFEEATRIAGELWGAETGPSADALCRALNEGRVRDSDIDAVLEDSPGWFASGVPGADERALVRVLLLQDLATPARIAWAADLLRRAGVGPVREVRTPMQALRLGPADPIDQRARVLAHHCCARSLAGPAWPGASGPWQELRATAPALDALLHLRGAGDVVAALPVPPAEAIAALLEHLGVSPQDRPDLLGRLLARDPGWPAHLTWRARHARLGQDAGLEGANGSEEAAQRLEELVATRLTLEVVVAQAHAPHLLGRGLVADDLAGSATHARLARLVAAVVDRGLVGAEPTDRAVLELARTLAPLALGGLGRLRAEVLEHAFRRGLFDGIGARAGVLASEVPPPGTPVGPGTPAQVVTCIDVRSERLRRHLEHVGPWETFGAAGFFGIPLRHTSVAGASTERTPALLRPIVAVTERPRPARGLSGSADALRTAVRTVEGSPALPFGWAEAVGWLLAPAVLLTTVLPAYARRLSVAGRRRLDAATGGDLDVVEDVGVTTLVEAASGFLAALGARDLAPVVMLTGHGGQVTNNPHVAAYDCGACGGASGEVNARAMAQALNDRRVRERLREHGVSLPDRTWFVAALHDTTRDVVDVLDRDEVPEALREVLERLEADLREAGDSVRSERLALLPGARRAGGRRPRRQVEDRAADWAQPRPEWGLAGAAAIVIGPRDLTAGLDLDGRVFLQSYRPELDPAGTVLEQLLTAPTVVAQWITSQYWASTVDPHRFGAGDKTTHNVLGNGTEVSAVVTGARGDLRLGLPWQAVSATAPDPDPERASGPWRTSTRHDPVRLLALVSAESAVVEQILARQPSVARLVAGGWMTLAVVHPVDGRLLRRTREGSWIVDRRPPVRPPTDVRERTSVGEPR